jgi:hypothetical protein
VTEVLAHFGVKGMRWGVRKNASSGPTGVEVATPPGRKVQTRGGERHGASEDAVRAAIAGQKARKSTTDSLSNKELQDLVQRLNLEQQFDRLRPKRPSEQAAAFLKKILMDVGKEESGKFIRDQVGQAIKKS